MTASSFPPPPKVRESRFDDWMWRFYKHHDTGVGASKWTESGSDIYRLSNVGIGTTSPDSALHVQQTTAGIPYIVRIWNGTAVAANVGSSLLLQGGTAGNGLGAVSAAFAGAATTDGAYVTISTRKPTTGALTEWLRVKQTGETVCNPSYVNVRQYGALGDGSTDDTTAIGNALTDAATNGMRRVYFPQGTYRTTSALSISGDFHLFGDGPNTSIIKVDHTGNGITFTGTITSSENQKLEVIGLGFRSNSSTADAAIECSWTTSGGGNFPAWPNCLICDVEINNASTTTAFQYGIKATNATHSLISNVNCFALENGTISGSSYGLHLTECIDTRIENCTFHYWETGVYGVDTEGLHFAGNVFLSCLDGIKIETTLTSGKPGLYITRNHLNVGRYGIHVIEQVQCFIGDNLIYGDQRTPTAGTTFMGVRIEAGSNASGVEMQSIIRDNIVAMVDESVSGYSTANYGYAVYGGTGTVESVIFKGNKSQACDTLIYLDSSTTKVVIADDNIGTSGETYSDNGSGNIIGIRKSSTPSVAAGSGTFTTVSAALDYEQRGDSVWWDLVVTITTNGTAATSIDVTMPFTANKRCVAAGREDATTGAMCQGIMLATSNLLKIYKYDNTYPGATGYIIAMSGRTYVA